MEKFQPQERMIPHEKINIDWQPSLEAAHQPVSLERKKNGASFAYRKALVSVRHYGGCPKYCKKTRWCASKLPCGIGVFPT